MKKHDFTQPGGFPLDQDELGYMRDGLNETVVALAMRGYDGVRPYVVYGCAMTRSHTGGTIYNYTLSPGWVFYAGELIEVEVCTVTGVDEATEDAYAVITSSNANLTYYDGLSKVAKRRKAIVSLAKHPVGTAGDAVKFAVLKHLLRWEWQVVSAAATGITQYANGFTVSGSSPIKYRLNVFENVVDIVGVTDHGGLSVTADYVVFTLPTGHRPAEEHVYIMPVTTGSDAYCLVRVKTNGEVSIAGDLMTASTVPVWLNIRVPLG